MSYGKVMTISVLVLLSSAFLGTFCDVIYKPVLTDDVCNCEDFKNEFMDCDALKLGSSKDEFGEDEASLSGTIKMCQNITEDHEISIVIYKFLPIGKELMYSTQLNFCQCMKSEDAPWSEMLEQLNINECPIVVGDYNVNNIKICLGALKDVLTHEFVGPYEVEVSLMNLAEKESCHIFEMSIEEEDTGSE